MKKTLRLFLLLFLLISMFAITPTYLLTFAQSVCHQTDLGKVAGNPKPPPECGSTITGIQYPPNLECKPNGYCKMPAPTDGSYQLTVCANHLWGSKLLIGTLYTVAKQWKQKYPKGYLRINDMNAAGHNSHKWGRAVDMNAVTNDGKRAADSTSGPYDAAKTIELGQMFLDTKQILNIWYSHVNETNALKAYARSKKLPFQFIEDPKNVPGAHFNHFHVDVNLKPLLPEWEPSC